MLPSRRRRKPIAPGRGSLPSERTSASAVARHERKRLTRHEIPEESSPNHVPEETVPRNPSLGAVVVLGMQRIQQRAEDEVLRPNEGSGDRKSVV